MSEAPAPVYVPEALRTVTREQFETDEAPTSIVDGLVYVRSTHTLNERSKGGKTWLALQLGMCISTGTPFLGRKTNQDLVLYLSFELCAGMVRERMRAIARDTGVPMPNIDLGFCLVAPTEYDVPQLDLGTPHGQADLEETINTYEAGVVIFDTFYRFIGSSPDSTRARTRTWARFSVPQRHRAAHRRRHRDHRPRRQG